MTTHLGGFLVWKRNDSKIYLCHIFPTRSFWEMQSPLDTSPAFLCPFLFLVHTVITNQFPLLLLSLALFSTVLRISVPTLQRLLALLPINNCRLELGRYGCRLMLKNIQQLLRYRETHNRSLPNTERGLSCYPSVPGRCYTTYLNDLNRSKSWLCKSTCHWQQATRLMLSEK